MRKKKFLCLYVRYAAKEGKKFLINLKFKTFRQGRI